MIYIATINIPERKVWGGVYQTELVVPSLVSTIRSVAVVALPQGPYRSRPEDAQISTTALRNVPDSAQTGTCSISIDNTQILIDGQPVYINALLERDGYNNLRTVLSEPATLHNGALLRAIVEECQISPFVASQNGTFPPYAVKIYLEYDR